MMGSGGMVVMDESTCMVDVARYFLDFLKEESCGKCVACREGIKRMLEILTRITEGNGTPADLDRLETLAWTVQQTSLCQLGKSAPNPVLSTLRYFHDEYVAHIRDKKCPAVVCIHGHGGNRRTPYAPSGAYRGFGLALAKRGFVTISTDVGQHEVYEKGRTLMGERLWDVMRCVTCLTTRPEVDAKRIGCAGLSLGGEMAMWLGAMDTRLAATVSSGFLTTVANMRRGHCPCWEFPHLTENFDFADVYSLIAPRPLCCQNGRKERAGGGFPVAVAQKAMSQIQACYAVFGRSDSARLVVHDEGHVIDLTSCLAFLDKHLGRKEDRQARQIGTRRSARGPGRPRGARIHPAARSA